MCAVTLVSLCACVTERMLAAELLITVSSLLLCNLRYAQGEHPRDILQRSSMKCKEYHNILDPGKGVCYESPYLIINNNDSYNGFH